MNPDDPLLRERRCDERLPALGIVCSLPAAHEGPHQADADPAALGDRVTQLAQLVALQRAAIEAGRDYVAVLERGQRRQRILVSVLCIVLVLNVGLRMAGA